MSADPVNEDEIELAEVRAALADLEAGRSEFISFEEFLAKPENRTALDYIEQQDLEDLVDQLVRDIKRLEAEVLSMRADLFVEMTRARRSRLRVDVGAWAYA